MLIIFIIIILSIFHHYLYYQPAPRPSTACRLNSLKYALLFGVLGLMSRDANHEDMSLSSQMSGSRGFSEK